jgi:hypothetical protein
MKQPKPIEKADDHAVAELEPADDLLPLILHQSANVAGQGRPLVVIGEVIATKDQGRTPLVVYPGQAGSAAVPARSTVDIDASHIGRLVVLLFESDEQAAPIVIGVLREASAWPGGEKPAQVDVQADGERLVVTARKQLVLRCGTASITLTEEGKVLIQGTYISTRASGMQRIKGGSVQIN